LASNGANWVINDFSEINVDQVSAFFRARAPAA
jgi:hypothetical protein